MRVSNRARLLGGTIIAGFMSVSLVACGGGDKGKDAPQASSDFTPQLGSVPKGEVDVDAFLAYLPDEIVASHEDVSYNEDTGITTIAKIRLTSEENTDFGLEIGELAVAGFDRDFVEARIASTNFDQSAVILDHLEARNISLFGVEEFYEQLNEKTFEFYEGVAEGIADAGLPVVEQSIEKIEYTIDKITIDDLEFLPFEVFEFKGGEGDDVSLAFFQTYASYYRAFGAKLVSTEGMSTLMDMTQDGLNLKMSFLMPLSVTRGWHGGDFEHSSIENMTFNMDMPLPDANESFPYDSVEMSGSFGSYLIEDLRLRNALEWVARGEWPPTTETNLMSFGKWTIKDADISMFGAPYSSIESSVTDLTKFHWLIPTEVKSKTENLVYDFKAFSDVIESISQTEGADPEQIGIVAKAINVLEGYDLAAVSMDLDIGWDWDPATGVGELRYFSGLDGYGTMALNVNGAIPAFREMAQLVGAEGTSDQFDDLMAKSTALGGFKFEMEDRGGNQRLYEVASALGKELKEYSTELAVLAAYDVDTMKLLVGNAVKGAAAIPASEFPPAAKWADALANYLTDGGTFTVEMKPKTPISIETLEALEGDVETPEEMEAILDEWGFRVAHAPN